MIINSKNYSKLISNLSREQKLNFYGSFAVNITIAIREIWADEEISNSEKIERMKWLNELQHRIISKISVERTQSHEWKESDINSLILEIIKNCPGVSSDISWIIQTSYNNILNNTK